MRRLRGDVNTSDPKVSQRQWRYVHKADISDSPARGQSHVMVKLDAAGTGKFIGQRNKMRVLVFSCLRF